MPGYIAEVVADSVSPDGVRLTTILTSYPRFIHAEMLRHRVFSHSVASSRAIPTERLIGQVVDHPFVPETFNKRVKGMGVGEPLSGYEADRAQYLWMRSAQEAVNSALQMIKIDVDKSRINRLLEPFLFVTDLITATEWSNFFALRDHPDAQPEFQKIARMMREAMNTSEPDELGYGDWHLPLVNDDERFYVDDDRVMERGDRTRDLCLVSAGRCARVSFDTHDLYEEMDSSKARADRLIASGHMSPFEHVARPMRSGTTDNQYMDYFEDHGPSESFAGNLRGWVSIRSEIPYESDFSKILAEREGVS